jgi:hypothetical protein
MRKYLYCVLGLLLTGVCLAQTSTLLFEDVKLYYQRPGETKFSDDKGLMVLDGNQKVMLILKDNQPLFIMRYENINSMTFDEQRSKTLTIQYGASSSPSGSVRMELPGKWRDILQTIQAQSGTRIEMTAKKH